MYTVLSIILYIIAFVMISLSIFLFIRAISRKRDTKAPSLESELYIDPNTLQPVIPRHVRDQLVQAPEPEAEKVEPETQVLSVEKIDDELLAKTEHDTNQDIKSEPKSGNSLEALQLNPEMQVQEIEAFQGESELLIANLHEDDDFVEDEGDQMMEFYVYLDDADLKGDRFLKILERYSLQFGEENYFHRYHQDENGEFHHMFSLAKRTYEGTTEAFDINTLPSEQINAVVFFLTLPHYDAVTGYDMMMTSMHRMARELKGRIFDGHRNELTSQMEEDLRNAIKEYVS